MPDPKPWERYGGGQGVPAGGVVIGDPYQARDEGRKDTSQAIEMERLRIAQGADSRSQATAPYDAARARTEADRSALEASGYARKQEFERADKLRADYEALPSVKNYTQALPVYGAGLSSSADPAGDINLVYAYAKVMDPNSVVREGEQATVANADTWMNAKVAELKKQLGQGGSFTPAFRRSLREEMAGRMGQLNQSFIADRVKYKQIADRYQVNPLDVVGEHPGTRFQELSQTVLGRPQKQLDYNGQPVNQATQSALSEPGGPIATGDTKSQRNPERERVLDGMLRSGAPLDAINATSKAMGGLDIPEREYSRMRDYITRHPDDRRGTFDTSTEVPSTSWNQFVASPVGTGMLAAADAGLAGLSDEIIASVGGGDLADLNARKQGAFSANPKSAFAGQVAGSIVGMKGLGVVGGMAGVGGRLATPLAGDIAFGALSGAGQSNDNRLLGAALGAGGGAAGNYAGRGLNAAVGAIGRTRPVAAAIDRTLGMFGRSPIAREARPASADMAAFEALERSGPSAVASSLEEADRLGVPMSLADTNPYLRELAGAAVRRSPAASRFAEEALVSRNRGQYDRFVGAVERDLGPTTNIPQRSAELTAQARQAASGLYDRAYAKPVPSTPEMIDVLGTPFGRQALGRARTIAANERRSPDELGFSLDGEGNVALNPRPNQAIADHLSARSELDAAQYAYRTARNSPNIDVGATRNRVEIARANLRRAEAALKAAPDPSMPANVPAYTTQTLDYVKRGMDDVLEAQRNPITGRLVLDEAGRAQNGVRGQLLSELDRLNPTYAAARSAYAGPASSREALLRGGEVYGLHPDELAINLANKSPEHLMQMQLGYRGALVDHASKVRDSSNPWEATLGSPMARQRLAAMHPNASAPSGFRNIVHDKPAIQVGRAGPSDHVAEDGFTYRSLSDAEVASAEATGSFLPNPSGRSSGGQLNAKHWVNGGPQSGQFYRSGQTVVRVPQSAVSPNAPVQAADASLWSGGGWNPLDISASPAGRVSRLLRMRELESDMQQTTNSILGNSRTARNVIADQAFAGSPLAEGALHAGAAVVSHGASIPGTVARVLGAGVKDRLALGVGRRAETKAEAIAPILLDTNPASSLATARNLAERSAAWRAYVESTTPRRPGMFGGAFGAQATVSPFNY